MIGKIATGEIGDLTTCKNAAAVALRRMGGNKVRSESKAPLWTSTTHFQSNPISGPFQSQKGP
jgi:hypothetical protein